MGKGKKRKRWGVGGSGSVEGCGIGSQSKTSFLLVRPENSFCPGGLVNW
jgi:hypothetical protein